MKQSQIGFSSAELMLWGGSVGLILISHFLFPENDPLVLAASVIGATSLIFNAKGNPIGQVLMILFSLLYGRLSDVSPKSLVCSGLRGQ